jgi:hypothetical protein
MKKGMKKVMGLFLVLGMLFVPSAAMADWLFYPTAGFGSPGWQDPGGVKYDSFLTVFDGGNAFSSAAIGTDHATVSFTVGGWSGAYINPNVSLASGLEVGPGGGNGAMQWNYNLSGSGPVYPLVFDIYYYDNCNFQLHEHDLITGHGQVEWYTDFQPIPLPPAIFLFGSGLLGLAGIGLRKKMARG